MTKAQSTRATMAGSLPEPLQLAARTAYEKMADEVAVLDLRKADAFTDYFVICSGRNPRQVTAMAEAIELALAQSGLHPAHVEGYARSEWVLLDYFDFVVHVFTAETRRFYALERLWGNAERIDVPEPHG
jgi:ribosome-associated protein